MMKYLTKEAALIQVQVMSVYTVSNVSSAAFFPDSSSCLDSDISLVVNCIEAKDF